MDMLIDRIQDNHYRFRIWSLLKLVGIRLCIPDFNIAVNDSLSIELQSICSLSSLFLESGKDYFEILVDKRKKVADKVPLSESVST